MVKEITILIGDEECTAGLLTEQAPRTCGDIENGLPFGRITGNLEGFQYVSKLSGK